MTNGLSAEVVIILYVTGVNLFLKLKKKNKKSNSKKYSHRLEQWRRMVLTPNNNNLKSEFSAGDSFCLLIVPGELR